MSGLLCNDEVDVIVSFDDDTGSNKSFASHACKGSILEVPDDDECDILTAANAGAEEA